MNNPVNPSACHVEMPRRRHWLVVFIIVLAGAVGEGGRAQEAADSAKPQAELGDSDSTTNPQAAAGPAAGRVQYVGPDTYILLDSAGRPQAMPGMTYEDFLAAWKKLNQAKATDNQPGYAIESLSFNGTVIGQHAELHCEATVRLLADGPADIPLGLVGAILQGEPHFEQVAPESKPEAAAEPSSMKSAEFERLTYDPERGGYVARFVGHSDDRRSLSMQLIVPLLHDGPETTLPINCPRALSSQLDLNIGSEISEARTTGGTLLSRDAAPNGGTMVKVAGPAGLFRLTWQSAAKDAPAFTSVLNALGAVQVTIDGRGVRSDARLTVRSYGGTFDQFRVRLPLGAQLIQARPDTTQVDDAKYRIRIEPDSSQPPMGKADARRQVVVVELPEKQQGPVVVDLATEQSVGVENRDQEINLAGFEVLGAVRQFGDVALTVADDWQARWEIGAYVRQVDPSELEPTLQTSNPTAAFQYDRQPWSLNVRVARRQLRVHVTPKFELECRPEETRLSVKLAYQLFGARAFGFRVELNGWEMTGDPVESGSLVDQDRVEVTSEGTLVLPLTQASSRRAEVSFSLRRAVNRDATRLELPLPVPVADSVGTGELVVRAAPDLNLLPDLSNSTGISAASTPQVVDPAGNNDGTELHFRTLLPAAVFVTDRANRAREISTQAIAQIEIAQNAAQVEERIEYTVRFEPVTELAFEAPNELASAAAGLEIQLLTAAAGGDTQAEEPGTPLHLNLVNDENPESLKSPTRQLRAMLPRPQIGKFSARIRYRVPLPKLGAADTVWPIPLAHSVDGKSGPDRVDIRAPRSLTVRVDTATENVSWKPAHTPNEDSTPNSTQVFVADNPEPFLPLILHAGRSVSPSSTIVDRVWLQTWLSNDVVQDRAAFRFRTTGSQATVELPPDTSSGEIEVLVDRRPAEVLSRAPGRIVVRLGPSAGGAASETTPVTVAYTLELRSRQPYRHRILSRHRLTPPQIEGSTALSQVYWQIVLPSDEHVIDSPAQLTSASQWQWLGSFWGRRPVKLQAELEEWVGAGAQMAPADAQNQYLFTGLLPVATIELATGPRWLIVLAASAAVLALVLTWLYVPGARRTWIVVAVLLMIAISAIAYPTAALLLAQASLIGIVLAALSLMLSRFAARPARASVAPIISPSSQRMVMPRTDPMFVPPFAAASTAPTVSLRMSESDR